jgi:hypothetical protein
LRVSVLPQISPCSTYPVLHLAVAKSKQNLTLVIEEDLLLAARKVALDRRTSVNQLVREYLTSLVEQTDRQRLARERLMKMMEHGLYHSVDITWSRDDLYDRGSG